jgi:hypothetical protein
MGRCFYRIVSSSSLAPCCNFDIVLLQPRVALCNAVKCRQFRSNQLTANIAEQSVHFPSCSRPEQESDMNPNPNDSDPANRSDAEPDDRPGEAFPPFDDPAHSSKPATPPPTDMATHRGPPKDTQYADHPDFSQDAAENKLPSGGIGNSERVDDVNEKTRHSDGQNPSPSAAASPDPQKLGAGPAVAEHSKDAWEEPLRSKDDPAERSPNGAPGTSDQLPRWEGPPANRPRGYLPAVDDPENDRDAAGENLADPDKSDLGDALKTRGD